jgi:hypothetical protein
MKCKISDCGCVYHACMSNDCQKRFMILYNDYGKGKCEEIENEKEIIDNEGR